MSFLIYQLFDSNFGVSNVEPINSKSLKLLYPCSKSDECTEYEVSFLPGVYRIELYGASGGYKENFITAYKTEVGNCPYLNKANKPFISNVECTNQINTAGAGGYTSGIIRLHRITKAFLSIGGAGQYGIKIKDEGTSNCYKKQHMIEGGYNGGGWASNFGSTGSGSGGGATDIRFETNDVFHRVLVAGGGGGTDDQYVLSKPDDGSGGAGGGEIAQSFFLNGIEDKNLVANQTFGFSFGSGESVQEKKSIHPNGATGAGNSDRGGAGGGWFGGFASQSAAGGAGGGSSFALTSYTDFTNLQFEYCDTFREKCITDSYAFTNSNKYSFSSTILIPGVWAGNGFAIITQLSYNLCSKSQFKIRSNAIPLFLIYVLLK